ncbi:hypothetical protein F4679DRAFT_589330 [Xylaria curta]|nr:hypothetical protein F4679DRAFT_589330 [Xylaria curta]
MLGSVGICVAYALTRMTNNYCLHRLDVAIRGLGAGPDDSRILAVPDTASVVTIDSTPSIASNSTSTPTYTSTSTSAFTPVSIPTSTSTSILASTSTPTSTSTSTFTYTPTSTYTSTSASTSTSTRTSTSTFTYTPTSTYTSTSASTSTSTHTRTSTSTYTSTSTSTSVSTSTPATSSTSLSTFTKVSTMESATTSTFTKTSTAFVMSERSTTLEPSSAPEPVRDITKSRDTTVESSKETSIKSQATLESPAQDITKSRDTTVESSKETSIKSQAPAKSPAPSSDFSHFELATSENIFGWDAIYKYGEGQKHPFNLTSSTDLEDLQWITAELLHLSEDLKVIAKESLSKHTAQEVNALEEVLAFVAIAPLREMSKILMELQVRFVKYNADKPPRASDSVQMGPFILDALERLEQTMPEVEGLSPEGKLAYNHLTESDPNDWRARVLSGWRNVNRIRDILKDRLAEVERELTAKDEAEWLIVLAAFKTLMWALSSYAVILTLGRLLARGYPIYPRQPAAPADRAPEAGAPAPEPGAPGPAPGPAPQPGAPEPGEP